MCGASGVVLCIGSTLARADVKEAPARARPRGNDYAILDHQLERYVAGFVRFGTSPNQFVSEYVDAGLRIGPGPFRDHDFIGLGIAYAKTADLSLGEQTVYEATYQARTAKIFATRATVVF